MQRIYSKAISMGKPITAPCLIPVLHASTPSCIHTPFMVDGKAYIVTAISFGSPHGAVFVDDLDSIDVPELGRALGKHALFPQGASIVFAQMQGGQRMEARLWQRGEGETALTPEAACVAGTAAMMSQKTVWNEIEVYGDDSNYSVKWDRCREDVSYCVLAD